MVESKAELGLLSVRGHDKIGISATSSGFLADRGLNIVEESCQVLSVGFFCNTLVFHAPADKIPEIRKEAEEDANLSDLQPLVDVAAPRRGRALLRYSMDVTARDKPRIVAKIEKIMLRLGINITHATGRSIPSLNGVDLYKGMFDLEIPNASAVKQLRAEAQALESKYGWEIDLRDQERPPPRLEVFVLKPRRSTRRSSQGKRDGSRGFFGRN